MTRPSIPREHAAVISYWVSRPGLASWSSFREIMSESVSESECISIPRDRIGGIPIAARLSSEMIRSLLDCRRRRIPIPSVHMDGRIPNKSWMSTAHNHLNFISFSPQLRGDITSNVLQKLEMPISIRQIAPEGKEDTEVAWLGDDEWSLPLQIDLLEAWIEADAGALPPGEYVADVGFCWRRDAAGGGSALGPEFMLKLSNAGFSLFLSEYPGFSDGQQESKKQNKSCEATGDNVPS